MVSCYFAYGSNMNPARVRDRGLAFQHAVPGRLAGYVLRFDKQSRDHAGTAHANIGWDPAGTVEGVLYRLRDADEIWKMDPFEHAPINYSREVVLVDCAGERVAAWTYFANPGVIRSGLLPERAYLDHLLAGAPFLSSSYLDRLRAWPCVERPT